jgi:putative transposase
MGRQLSFVLPKLDKNGQRRGGKRKGAGRKPNGPRAGEPHDTRPELMRRFPVHVTMRVLAAVAVLRRRDIYHAIRFAMVSLMCARNDVRVVHLSIQHGHLHLLVEARDKIALARGMQTLKSVAARFINEAISKRTGQRRRGPVFDERYHEEIIKSPRQAHHAIRYVLGNWRKHREDRADFATGWKVDPFSTAVSFPGWAECADSPLMWKTRDTYKRLPTWLPKTWLLRVGWKRGGDSISCYDVPGARA